MKFLITSAALICAFVLCGAAVDFRSGKILAAEVGTAKPTVNNWNKHLFDFDVNNVKAYAAVAVKLHPKRQISIYDYSLEVNGIKHPCVAIRTNSGTFEYTQKSLSGAKGDIYTLLFFLSNIAVPSDKSSASLVSNLPPEPYSTAVIKLTRQYNNSLCAFNTIKKDGNF